MPSRVAEAETARWHGEAEGLKVTLAGASHKLTQMDQITARRSATINLGMPDFAAPPGRTITNPGHPYPNENGHFMIILSSEKTSWMRCGWPG